MTKELLVETVSTLVRKGNRWKVVLAVPGKGMSGNYTADMLRESGPVAFPAGTKAFIGHALPQDRDIRDQFGKYPIAAYFDDDFDPIKYPEGALVSELEVFDHYKQMIDQIGTDAELSLSAIDYDREPDGTVTRIYPHRANSIDLVAFGGLEGSGLREKLEESLKISANADDKPSGETSAQENEQNGNNVELKDVVEKLEALNAKFDTLASAASAEAIAKVEADAKTKAEAEVGAKVDEALSAYEDKVAAIEAAEDLTPAMVESLKAEARKGVDVKPLIESYSTTVKDIKAALTESFSTVGGVRINEGASKTDDFTVGGLN